MAPQPPAKMPVTWTVISQQEVTDQDKAGNYVQGARVTFQLNTGTTGSVFVPTTIYNAETVAEAINKAAHKINNVDHLSGSVE